MGIEAKERAIAATLPGDAVRQILWRYEDRYDLQMVVQSARGVARGVVAHLVAEGQRRNHEWNDRKNEMLEAFDAAGLTTLYMEPEEGGFLAGPKNLALGLVCFELAWVDGGAATCSMASNLALSPIHERGTPEQKQDYMSRCVPPQPGEDRPVWRGAFALTEPLPYVGVDTGVVSGRVSVAEWPENGEPLLKVEKRGRFITNMDFASFVTAAVDSGDERIKGSCMVILEKGDPGIFDRGAPTMKMVHQLSSTRDPIFSLTVPASRIVGGYTVKDGVIVPNFNHSEVIEAVFRRTRVPIGLMSAAKLLSAVEPIIRYQRSRFRGGAAGAPGSPRHELGLQQKDDAIQRLASVWAAGEAAASLGFAALRLLDEFDPVEREKDEELVRQGVEGARARMKLFKSLEKDALEAVSMDPADPRSTELNANPLIRFLLLEAQANILCPACKLWNTGHTAVMMREAVTLMGGYGITEDCPGFLFHKWTDAQLEATYEGPEAVQRRQMSLTLVNPLFLAQMRAWAKDLRALAASNPEVGAATLAAGIDLWLWTVAWLQSHNDAEGKPLYHGQRHGVVFPLSDALCWLLASRYQILDALELAAKGPESPLLAEGLEGMVNLFNDLAAMQAGRAAGEVGRICAELVCGFQREEAEDEEFAALRRKLDRGLAGMHLAQDRVALALTKIVIPEIPDYPV
ncbi:MAG: acyl-CoA/acyl-ACP dehydrogenase [Deltaproteobacteria bacterium]|nr:acyl-CoA/acyl-ACP dehydrogenase [Deltaproteobacteria bacterium]